MSLQSIIDGYEAFRAGLWRRLDRLVAVGADARHADPLSRRRYRMSCWVALASSLLIIPLGVFDLLVTGYVGQALGEAASATVLGWSWFALTRGRRLDPYPFIITIANGALILLVVGASHPDDHALVWAPLFPLVPLYLLGAARGLPVILTHLAVLVFLLLNGATGDGTHADTAVVNTLASYITAFALALYYENSRVHAFRQLNRVADTDPLTEILNVRGFRKRFEAEFARARRVETPLSLLIFDIDHFKHINDRHGHDVGDEAIRHVASLLVENCRGYDVVARLGGEEFAVLLPETSAEQAVGVAEKLRRVVAETALVGAWGRVDMTVSVGVDDLTNDEDDDFQTIFARADRRLYRAKAGGRNRVA